MAGKWGLHTGPTGAHLEKSPFALVSRPSETDVPAQEEHDAALGTLGLLGLHTLIGTGWFVLAGWLTSPGGRSYHTLRCSEPRWVHGRGPSDCGCSGRS